MTFERIKLPKVSDAIVEQIEDLILKGVLRPGDKLPPERELASQLEVSRPSLREALLRLEAKGLLQNRRGGGTFVTDIVAPTITDPLVHLLKDHPEATLDILELRHALEEVAAYFAATRRTPTDCEILQRRFDDLVASHEYHDALRDAEADTEFHLAVADASHNVALVHVMRGMFNLLRGTIYHSLERLYAQEGNFERVHGQHEAIFRAVMDGDPQAAREAAHLHLTYVERSLREAYQEERWDKDSRHRLRLIQDPD